MQILEQPRQNLRILQKKNYQRRHLEQLADASPGGGAADVCCCGLHCRKKISILGRFWGGFHTIFSHAHSQSGGFDCRVDINEGGFVDESLLLVDDEFFSHTRTQKEEKWASPLPIFTALAISLRPKIEFHSVCTSKRER